MPLRGRSRDNKQILAQALARGQASTRQRREESGVREIGRPCSLCAWMEDDGAAVGGERRAKDADMASRAPRSPDGRSRARSRYPRGAPGSLPRGLDVRPFW